jgi:hypothetical protein
MSLLPAPAPAPAPALQSGPDLAKLYKFLYYFFYYYHWQNLRAGHVPRAEAAAQAEELAKPSAQEQLRKMIQAANPQVNPQQLADALEDPVAAAKALAASAAPAPGAAPAPALADPGRQESAASAHEASSRLGQTTTTTEAPASTNPAEPTESELRTQALGNLLWDKLLTENGLHDSLAALQLHRQTRRLRGHAVQRK